MNLSSSKIIRLRLLLLQMVRNKRALTGLIMVVSLATVSLLAPWIAPFDPVIPDQGPQFAPPSWNHWFGTDDFGRDMLSRVLYGGRKALIIAFLATLLTAVVGTTLGIFAGFVGKVADQFTMRLMDMLQAIPWLVLALTVAAFLGTGFYKIIIALALPGIPSYARLARSVALSVRENSYVLAARAIGDRPASIMLRQILPNSLAPIVVLMTLGFGSTLIAESGLSFVGLGTQPPEPSWGRSLDEARSFIRLAPWTVVFPGLAITWGVIGFNLFGDGLRDVLDPRLRNIN